MFCFSFRCLRHKDEGSRWSVQECPRTNKIEGSGRGEKVVSVYLEPVLTMGGE